MGDEYYNQIARGYQELHGEEQLRKARIVLYNLVVSPSDSLLDVGCGNAKYLSIFPCRKMGIDPAHELSKLADITVVHGVAEKLPFSENEFDIVISLTAVHNFDDFGAGLQEMLRVSRRDIVVSLLKKSPRFSEIVKAISQILPVRKRVEDLHDVIFFASKV
jgi:ubiquinone/menaquinone biosynthesis C-methylase UbiE